MEYPSWFLHRMLFITIAKGEAERVREFIGHGADPNWRTKKDTPAIVRAARAFAVDVGVVKVLLENGADPSATDAAGLTALDHVRRRLQKYEGKPRRKPRRSPSLTSGAS